MKKISSLIESHKYISSFVSGIIFATPFISEWLFPFVFLGLVIFFYATFEQSEKPCSRRIFNKNFFEFFFFFFGCCLTVYTVFLKLYPLEGYDFTKWQQITVVIVAWIFSSLIHGFMGGFILSFSQKAGKTPLTYALSCGALWVIFEYSTSLGFLAFPWINVSIALIKFLPFIQTASLFGNGIITFITVFSSCCIALFLKDGSRKRLIKISAILLSANLLAGLIIFLLPEEKEEEVSVCIIQGNLAMGDKWKNGILPQVIAEHDLLIRENLKDGDFDIVLMAETVFPAIYTENGLIYRTLSQITREFNVTVIFGVVLKNEADVKYNAMMAIYPDGSVSAPYVKQKLVPFGEKLPSLDIIGALVPEIKELNLDSSYIEGTESTTVSSKDGIEFGALICFDSVFSSLSRESVLNGAELLLVSTNDSWYKDGMAVRHHQRQSVIRAIETGRYVFRSANTGISCIISSKGIITNETQVLTKDAICGVGYTSNRKTLFVILGNTSLYFSFIAIGALFTVPRLKRKNCTHNQNK